MSRINREFYTSLQKRLIEEGVLFNVILDTIGAYVFVKDTQGRYIYVNKKTEELFNRPAADIMGETDETFFSPASVEEIRKSDRPVIEKGETVAREEVALMGPDSVARTYWTVKIPLRDDSGAIFGICGISTDISERKKNEEILHESEEKFRALFENVTEGVALHEVLYDAAGIAVDYRITGINPAYEHHTGLKPDQVVGRLGTEVYGTAEPPYMKEFGAVAQTREPYRFETFFPPMQKYFSISVISPKQGQFATVFEDITDRKKKEEDLKQKNEELARFTYTVSHDLKSPLVTIKAFASYLSEDMASHDEAAMIKDIAFIKNAADKMGKLLDELLELSRIGRKDNPKKEIRLQPLVNSVLELVAGRIRERSVSVMVTEKPVILYGDEQRLIQLYQNLLDNAVKFMGSQEAPVIEVGAENRNGEPVLFVRDNGSGIDQRYGHKLFGLFEKLDTKAEGTGIGLALVRRIVEVHNGRVWFESDGPGMGTTFYFTLEKTRIEKTQGRAHNDQR